MPDVVVEEVVGVGPVGPGLNVDVGDDTGDGVDEEPDTGLNVVPPDEPVEPPGEPVEPPDEPAGADSAVQQNNWASFIA